MNRLALLSVTGFILLITGCSSIFGPAEVMYRGHYSFGFERMAFTACDSPRAWWVARGDPAISGFIRDNAEAFQTGDLLEPYLVGVVYVEVRGKLSSRGRHGHLGGYERELAITETIDVRMPRADDCS